MNDCKRAGLRLIAATRPYASLSSIPDSSMYRFD